MLGTRPVAERLLDFMIRTGHRGDGFGADPGGLTFDDLEQHPHGLDFGPLVARMPEELTTESGLIEIGHSVLVADLDRLAADLDEDEPSGLVLVGRRDVRTANSWTHNVEVLVKGRNRCTLQINPADAERLGIDDGNDVTVTSSVGSIDIPAEITDAVIAGVVCAPYGWGHGLPGTQQSVAARYAGVNANVLTPVKIDPLSGNATLNGIPVEVAPA
jgi:anaerobic selenocysteine-containing dehydrogenase